MSSYNLEDMFTKKRKTGPLSSKRIYSQTSAGSQANQIAALTKQVRAVKRVQKGLKRWAQYIKTLNTQGLVVGNGASLTLQHDVFNCFPLITPTSRAASSAGGEAGSWNGIFQQDDEESESNQITLNSVKINTIFSITNTEEAAAPMPVSYMIIAHRRGTGRQFQSDAGFSFTGTNSTYLNIDHMDLTSDAMTANGKYFGHTAINVPNPTRNEFAMLMANPQTFRVLKESHFYIGNINNATVVPESDVSVTNISDTVKQVRCTLPLKINIKAAEGTWKEQTCETLQADEQLYLVVHYGLPDLDGTTLNMASQILFNGWSAN